MQTREAATLSYFSRTPEGPLLSVSVNILDGSSWVLHRQIHAIEKGCPIASFHLPLFTGRSALHRDYLFFRSVKALLGCDADQKFLRLAIRLINHCFTSLDITGAWSHEVNVATPLAQIVGNRSKMSCSHSPRDHSMKPSSLMSVAWFTGERRARSGVYESNRSHEISYRGSILPKHEWGTIAARCKA